MKISNNLFVDADAFVAIRNASDPNHRNSLEYAIQAAKAKFFFITSDPAFGEAITIISQNVNLKEAVSFAEDTLSESIVIVEVDSRLRRIALDIFKKQTSKNSRFTDCVNMAIMREEGLDTVFSFDEHYKKNGFKRFGIDK